MSEECKDHLTKKPVFLPRGIRSYAKSPFGKMKQHNHYKAPPATAEKDAADKADKDDKAKDGGDGDAAATTTDNASSKQTKDESKESATEDEEMPSESEKG